MAARQPRGRKRRRRAQEDRKLIALMGRSLEGAVAFIERVTGESLTPEEIEELKRGFTGIDCCEPEVVVPSPLHR